MLIPLLYVRALYVWSSLPLRGAPRHGTRLYFISGERSCVRVCLWYVCRYVWLVWTGQNAPGGLPPGTNQ